MELIRVSCFVDGFNLYHAIDDLGRSGAGVKVPGKNHLKWLDLRKLTEQFLDLNTQQLTDIHYFSAYATHRPDSYRRHVQYVRALQASGVRTTIAYFKKKDRHCKRCGHTWDSYEEKESDVRIALSMMSGAYKDEYDRAILISSDSDLAPGVECLASEFPHKTMRIIAPVGRYNSKALVKAAGGAKNARLMKEVHIAHALFPECVYDGDGNLAAVRPPEYKPPF